MGQCGSRTPGYGILSNFEGDKALEELPRIVYRLDPDSGNARAIIGDMNRPNGLCFNPDESLLYVVDVGEYGSSTSPATRSRTVAALST